MIIPHSHVIAIPLSLIITVTGMLPLLARQESVTNLMEAGTLIDLNGLLDDADATSMFILDITGRDLKMLSDYFTQQAHKAVVFTGNYKSFACPFNV